jgi:hypothetical protein
MDRGATSKPDPGWDVNIFRQEGNPAIWLAHLDAATKSKRWIK